MLNQKTISTITLALLFLVISSPLTYKLVNNTLTQPILGQKVVEAGVPTRFGLVVHSLVFWLVAHYIVLRHMK